MNGIKWIHENYNCITTNCLLDCPFFHSYQELLSVLIQYEFTLEKLYRKSLRCKHHFVMYHLKRVASQLLSDIKIVLKYLFQV